MSNRRGDMGPSIAPGDDLRQLPTTAIGSQGRKTSLYGLFFHHLRRWETTAAVPSGRLRGACCASGTEIIDTLTSV